jgi:hypothetical protein
LTNDFDREQRSFHSYNHESGSNALIDVSFGKKCGDGISKSIWKYSENCYDNIQKFFFSSPHTGNSEEVQEKIQAMMDVSKVSFFV